MVRFSCFNAHILPHKPKKTAHPFAEAKHKSLEDFSQIQAPKALTNTSSLALPNARVDAQSWNGIRGVTSSDVSVGQSWISDKIENKINGKNDVGSHQTRLIRKSQSLGSGLCLEGRDLCDNDTEEEIDHGVYSDSLDQNVLLRPNGSKDSGISPTSVDMKAQQLESVNKSSEFVKKESIFSIGDAQHSENEGPENSDTPLSGGGGNVSGDQSPHSHPIIEKACTFSDMGSYAPTFHRHSCEYLAPRSRSSEDLNALDLRWKTISIHGNETQKMKEKEWDVNVPKTEENNSESCLDEGFDLYNFSALAKDWIMPVINEVNLAKTLQGESSTQLWEELPSKDFKMKRIVDWVNKLQHYDSFEETNGLPDADDPVEGDSNDLISAKVDKDTPGIKAAKRYISSLSVSATTAHMSDLGLEVIPFLTVFGSLRVLNLSGNSFVRMSAGALPRGLRMLNLSRNNISTIEGLHELTRLRVLDLSYNQIFRIGHGLASCSSLKELYLAGNKISEVEGLHRLLKLTLLDLRFNKISIAKCLGLLAANHSSLQAISLEGNPVQKNVGDEQLKKYLQGLLPHLLYFNRQSIKASTLKNSVHRSVRVGINAHQFDRGLRSESKAVRKVSHGLAGSRPLPSSTHARKSQPLTSTKRSSGRHLRTQPSRTQSTTGHHHHFIDPGSKLLNFRSEFLVHRSQSEGTLIAF